MPSDMPFHESCCESWNFSLDIDYEFTYCPWCTQQRRGIPDEAEKMDKIVEEWKTQVYEESDAVDPDDQFDWEGVAMGFLIAKGLSLGEARDVYHARLLPEGLV